MNRITPFYMSEFHMQNPYDFAVVISSESSSILEFGIVVSETTKEDEIIWESKLPQGTFVQCLLKVSSDNQVQNNLSEHITYLNKQGYKTGVTVARYLVTALDDLRYDFYKAWIEIL